MSLGNSRKITRRAAVATFTGALGAVGLVRHFTRGHANVFIAANQKYSGDLKRTIQDGLKAAGLDVGAIRGRHVLLKPNMVEPTRTAPHMTTHPMLVAAAAEVFLGWGARLSIGEAPGHVRDSDLALDESGIGETLDVLKLPFADLNYQSAVWRPNAGGYSRLGGLWLPQTVAEADLVVSMPKMKTHHWMGVTAAMKNMYGILPGLKYGWPKNVLHHNGIPETVADINTTVSKTFAIVDGIDCMEGDGPIMGTPKHMGVLVMGANLPAVDATVCRLMKIDPTAVPYLALVEDHLGPLSDDLIEQRGEHWQGLASPFAVLDKPHLQSLVRLRT